MRVGGVVVAGVEWTRGSSFSPNTSRAAPGAGTGASGRGLVPVQAQAAAGGGHRRTGAGMGAGTGTSGRQGPAAGPRGAHK